MSLETFVPNFLEKASYTALKCQICIHIKTPIETRRRVRIRNAVVKRLTKYLVGIVLNRLLE